MSYDMKHRPGTESIHTDKTDDPTEHQQYRNQCQNETQDGAGSRGEV